MLIVPRVGGRSCIAGSDYMSILLSDAECRPERSYVDIPTDTNIFEDNALCNAAFVIRFAGPRGYHMVRVTTRILAKSLQGA